MDLKSVQYVVAECSHRSGHIFCIKRSINHLVDATSLWITVFYVENITDRYLLKYLFFFSSGKMNYLWLYAHRFIRLTPPFAAAILFCSTLLRKLDNGPMWSTFMDSADLNCHQYWWSALLYIQNYVNPDKMVWWIAYCINSVIK